METINAQTIPVGIVSRSELLKADLLWTTEIGRKTPKVKPILKSPKPHQIRAINDVLKGFKKIVVCELNNGQFIFWLRSTFPQFQYLTYHKVQGLPFLINELKNKFTEILKEI